MPPPLEDEEAKRTHALADRVHLHVPAHRGGRVRCPRVGHGEAPLRITQR